MTDKATPTPSPASVDKQAALVAKLRYMGKQYAAGQVARGGTPQKHYLEEAADEIEMMAWALSVDKVTPQSARENAALRNVIQVACIDGLPGLAQAWEKYFPDHPISIKGIEQSTAQPQAVVPARNRTPGFDASTPTGRPSRDWYAAKIHETLDDDFIIGPNAVAQPSSQAERAPVVQAAQATEKSNWWCAHCGVFVMPVEVTFTERHDPEAGGCGFSVSASSGAAQAVRMLTQEELEHCRLWYDGALNQQLGVLRKFCEVNAGRTIPADGKIGSAA